MADGLSTTLTIHSAGRPDRELRLEHNRYSLGRDADNDIVLPLSFISRRHGTLEKRGSDWFYVDQGSHNGTLLEGRKIEEAGIRDGTVLVIGSNPDSRVTLTFKFSNSSLVNEGTGMITVRSIEAKGEKSLFIGRAGEADIQLLAPRVSRKHAELRPNRGTWTIIDLNSTNGTFVNGQRISQRVLKQNDAIQVAHFRLLYRGGGMFILQGASRGLRLDGHALTWDVGKKDKRKRILDTINLSFYPQEFIGLVGGSGAGKSSLMKVMSGLLKPTKGDVLVEGEPLYQNYDAYRALIGYVPQDDILHKELTVEEALRYSAKLRLPPDISEEEIRQRIQKVLEQVELTGQRKQVINSLSGGQRKRASIAVELLADPPLFFLDEPTSGLDPGLEKKMMVTLRKLANGGKTIILVTHATANISECDHVAFMAQGRLVFFGPPAEAGRFFDVGSNNFADIYSQISDTEPAKAKTKAKEWEGQYKQSPLYKKFVSDRLASQGSASGETTGRGGRQQVKINPIRQFLIFTRRYLDLIVRDKILLTMLLGIMPVLAIFLLLIAEPSWLIGDTLQEIERLLSPSILGGDDSASYSIVKNGQQLIFMVSLAGVMLGLFTSAYEIVKERSIYFRERMVFLKLFPYLMSKVFLLGGFAALQCLLFLAVISLKIKFPAEGVFLPSFIEIYITMLLGAIAAIMLGLLVSSLAPNANSVTYLILGLLFVQIIFSGVIFELPGVAGQISKLTLTRWTTEGIGVSTDIEYLNSLTRTRFKVAPITEEVSFEVEKPADDWEPVTVVQEMQQVPGCRQEIPMPVITENEMVTEMETVTESVTVEPDPVDISTPFEFSLDYTRSVGHLFKDWLMLLGLAIVFGGLNLYTLKRQDVIK